MKLEKPSQILALFAWAFVFVEAGLLVIRKIPADGLSWGFFALFFFVAAMASAVANGGDKKPTIGKSDLIVKVGDEICTVNNGKLVISPEQKDGTVFVSVLPLNREKFERSKKLS